MISTEYLYSLVLVLAIPYTHATQVMQRPADYATKTKPNIPVRRPSHEMHSLSIGQFVPRADMGRVNVGYFTNWGIYGRGFFPQDIDVSSLTHVLYAFADVSPESGAVVLSDTWSDQQKHYTGDTWDDSGNNLYGNFKQLYILKKANRSLNVLLSIGGWTYSQAGHFNFVTDDSKRATFVSSALAILEDNGLDGFDLDFEYPTAGAQAQAFSKLLSELRTALDDLANKKGDKTPYQISAAVPAGADNYQGLPIKDMDPSLSFWNLMAYDYAGSWSNVTDHQANLYGPSFNNVSTDLAVKWYTSNGACPGKINLGIPLYGRGFENTDGVGKPFSGVGSGSWEAGIYDYKVLPFPDATVTENSTIGTSYSYDSTKKQFISYDTPNMAGQKAQYIVDNQLGGAMFWDLSGDKNGTESLVGKTAGIFGTLDSTQNHLNYPGSKFDNIKNGMGAGQNASTPASNSTAPANDAAMSSPLPAASSSLPAEISMSPTQPAASSTGTPNSTWMPTSTSSSESNSPSSPDPSPPSQSAQPSTSSPSQNTSVPSAESTTQLAGDQNTPSSSNPTSDILSTTSSQSSSTPPIPSTVLSPPTTGPSASSTEAPSSTATSSITASPPPSAESSPSNSSRLICAPPTSSAAPSDSPAPPSFDSSTTPSFTSTAASPASVSTSTPNPSPPPSDSSAGSSVPTPSPSSSAPLLSSSISAPSDASTSTPPLSSSATSTSLSTPPTGTSTGTPGPQRIKRRRRFTRTHPRCFHSDAGRQILTC